MVPALERMVGASIKHTFSQNNMSKLRANPHVLRLFRIPYFEQTVKRPFNALDASLLILQGILASESLRSDYGPIIASVKIKQVDIGQEC